ncbi:Zinc finger, CCCH-type [Sesbania bispinosa]|nr:Zinc finger, CCCH-type [Sesbania bispinosa]
MELLYWIEKSTRPWMEVVVVLYLRLYGGEDHYLGFEKAPSSPGALPSTADLNDSVEEEAPCQEIQNKMDLTDEDEGGTETGEKVGKVSDFNDGGKVCDEESAKGEVCDGDSREKSRGRTRHYPLWPEAEDCAFYMKNGTCKFGFSCKFNHPIRRKNQVFVLSFSLSLEHSPEWELMVVKLWGHYQTLEYYSYWFLILKLGWGLTGAAITLNTSWWVIVIAQFGYIWITTSDGAWSGFSWLAFSDLYSFVKLSLASAVMLCLEFWYMMILVVITGRLANPIIHVDALSICMHINGWDIMIAFGFNAAISLPTKAKQVSLSLLHLHSLFSSHSASFKKSKKKSRCSVKKSSPTSISFPFTVESSSIAATATTFPSACSAFGLSSAASAESSSMFLMHDSGKNSTEKLEWRSSPNSLNFGSFELADSSSSCNLKTEEVMDEICFSIDQRRQDLRISERKGENRNLDEKEEVRIQQCVAALLEEQGATALLRVPQYLFDIKLERNVHKLFDAMSEGDVQKLFVEMNFPNYTRQSGYQKEESSSVMGPLLSSYVFEPCLTLLVQEMFLVAEFDLKSVSQIFVEDNVVLKLNLWIIDFKYIEQGAIIHAGTIVAISSNIVTTVYIATVEVVGIVGTSIAYGIYMAVFSNLRYVFLGVSCGANIADYVAQKAVEGGNLPDLNIAVAERFKEDTGLVVDLEKEVTITTGCTEAIAATILGLINPGNEVIVFAPFYDSYEATLSMAGAKIKSITLRPPDFAVPVEELKSIISRNTRAILMEYPCIFGASDGWHGSLAKFWLLVFVESLFWFQVDIG